MASEFVSQIVSHSHEFLLDREIRSVFALFSPEGEKLWAPGWDYTNLLGSEPLQTDYVFLTDTHDHRAETAIWIVSDYDPEKHSVSYYKVEPGEKVGKIVVQCREQGQASTLVEVTYKYIALSESGNRFIADFTRESYITFIDEWRSLIIGHLEKNSNRLDLN